MKATAAAPPILDHLHLAELARIERHLESCLRDLRAYRTAQQQGAADKGVLGSRGLTQFVIDQLKAAAASVPAPAPASHPSFRGGMTVTSMLLAAERAGYAIPTARTLSKRLTERSYRVGDIDWVKNGDNKGPTQGFWYWKGTPA